MTKRVDVGRFGPNKDLKLGLCFRYTPLPEDRAIARFSIYIFAWEYEAMIRLGPGCVLERKSRKEL